MINECRQLEKECRYMSIGINEKYSNSIIVT